MDKNLTINDIARLSGVSKTTVSFVINGKEGVSEETREKVLSVIEQTNYKPTLNSRRLYYQKSFTIAVVFDKSIPAFGNLFYFDIMNALMKRCTTYQYALVYSEFTVDGNEVVLPENILNKDIDGLIFLRDIPMALILKLHSLNIPFVVADDHSEHDTLYTVSADYRLAAYTAVTYLIEQGHVNIGFLGNMNLPTFYAQIFSGYQKALREAGLSIRPSLCYEKIVDRGTIEKYIPELLSSKVKPTAVFCMEDILAIELIRYLQKRGLRVPDDISVISIDDIILSSLIYPGLTTVSIDKEKIGISAVDMLIDLINGKKPPRVTISSNNLTIRESVRRVLG